MTDMKDGKGDDLLTSSVKHASKQKMHPNPCIDRHILPHFRPGLIRRIIETHVSAFVNLCYSLVHSSRRKNKWVLEILPRGR